MPKLTVWYDGSCPLCQREIALMRRLDRRGAIGFVNLDEAEPERRASVVVDNADPTRPLRVSPA